MLEKEQFLSCAAEDIWDHLQDILVLFFCDSKIILPHTIRFFIFFILMKTNYYTPKHRLFVILSLNPMVSSALCRHNLEILFHIWDMIEVYKHFHFYDPNIIRSSFGRKLSLPLRNSCIRPWQCKLQIWNSFITHTVTKRNKK